MNVLLVGGPYDGERRHIPDDRPIFPPHRELTKADKAAIPGYREYVYSWGRHPVTGERCLVWDRSNPA